MKLLHYFSLYRLQVENNINTKLNCYEREADLDLDFLDLFDDDDEDDDDDDIEAQILSRSTNNTSQGELPSPSVPI